jgi:hypothetical protein
MPDRPLKKNLAGSVAGYLYRIEQTQRILKPLSAVVAPLGVDDEVFCRELRMDGEKMRTD